MNYINKNLIILMISALVILPLLTTEILRILGNHVKSRLVNNFGMNSQVAIGGLGVVVHELAHLITAVIFLHHIGHFSLLEPKRYQYTGNLGYVEHYWNRGNLYESLGNFFIGLAPCFLCSECLWIIHGFLFSNQPLDYNSANNLSNAIQITINNIIHPFGPISWKLIIYIILIIMIASTGYGLSNADIHGVYSGLSYWLSFLIIIYPLIIFTGTTSIFVGLLWKAVVLWITFLGRGLIYLITSLIFINVLALTPY